MNEKQREALAHYRESVQQVFKSTNPVHHLYAIFLMTITYTDARIAGVWEYQLRAEYETIEELYKKSCTIGETNGG